MLCKSCKNNGTLGLGSYGKCKKCNEYISTISRDYCNKCSEEMNVCAFCGRDVNWTDLIIDTKLILCNI